MAVRRWAALAALVLAMTVGLVACDPPAGSGLTIKALTKTTGLNPGDPIQVKITGAQPNQRLSLFACAVQDCQPISSQTVTADRNGVATVRWNAAGTAGSKPWASDLPAAKPASCRPPTTCRLHVSAGWTALDGPIDLAPTSVAYTLTGRQLRFTATPTQGLRGGERITVQGTAPGAAGRKVRIARVRHFDIGREWWTEKVGPSVYVTVRADGSFSGTYALPADPAVADCASTGGDEAASDLACAITAWVVKADESAIDPTFGKPLAFLDFAPY